MINTKTMLRLLMSASTLVPITAHAQTASVAQNSGKTAAVTSADADTLPSNEIVVTAERRSSRLVDVPASVSVFTGDQLIASGITGSRDLRLVTPGLNITQQGTYTQPTIRGIGTTVTGTGADPSVAIYVDGVYIASQGAALMEFSNIKQIETLKGPQGTLYGRNATGGAIVVTTSDPSLSRNSANLDLSFGNLTEIRAFGDANLALSSKVAINIAGYYRDNNGYTKNVAHGDQKSSYTNASGVRGKILFEPSESVRFVLSGAHVYQSDNTAYSYLPLNNNTPFRNSTAAALSRANSKEYISLNNSPTNTLEFNSVALNAYISGNWGTVTSITAYAYTKYPFLTDLDGTEVNSQTFVANPQTQETTSQEFIFASPQWGKFNMVGGLFFYNDDSTTQARILVGGNPLPFPPFQPYVRVNAKAFAAYAQGTFNITPELHLTAGGRYSTETKKARNNNGGPNGLLMLDASETFPAFTPMASLRYDLSPQSSIYGSYTEGYKSGLFDGGATGSCTSVTSPNCPSSGTPVLPENVTAFEVGYKYNAGRTVFTTAAYYATYKNIQINALNAINQQVLYNAAAGEIYGAEVELKAYINDQFSVHVGGNYTHARYTDFPFAQNFVPLPNGGNKQVTGNDTGNTMIRTPEWTGFVSGNYSHPLPTGSLEANLLASYSSRYYQQVDNRLSQAPFVIVNGRISWVVSDTLTLTAYGDNLTNQRTQLYVREATVGDFASYSRPTTYGVGISLHY